MLTLRRRPVRTHSQLAKKELRSSLDHLAQAANHAAGGVGATVGPRVEAARDRMGPAADKVKMTAVKGFGTTVATVAPLAVAAREGARRARGRKPERQSRQWPKLTMLLASGVAVGAAAAFLLRHRQRQQWEEYDPSRPMDTATATSEGPILGSADEPHRSTTMTAEEMADRASSAVDTARSRPASGEPTMPISGNTRSY